MHTLRNVRFSENLTCFVFLKQPFSDLSFCLITEEHCAKNVRICSFAGPCFPTFTHFLHSVIHAALVFIFTFFEL